MDLQLNLSTNSKKNKSKKNFKEKSADSNSSCAINFVKKPSIEGHTIAKRRKPPLVKSDPPSSFSFLKSKPIDEISKLSSKTNSPKKTLNNFNVSEAKPIENFSNELKNDDSEFSLNITNNRTKSGSFKNESKNKKKYSDHETTNFNSKKNENTKRRSNRDEASETPNKNTVPTFKQISALFKNNPEIPKIGQRHVKPVNEKLFSGKNFSDLNIHSFNVANLEKNMGLKELTVVQQKAIPVILKGRDVLVRSQTGSGKTLAYALPIVDALQAIRPKLKRQDGIKALVIVPTRELALQTYELFLKLVRSFTWIVPGYLIGGENRKAEKARLRKGFNILIGTPGRITDHLKHTVSLRLNKARCLILDEADRLLDMGYEKDVSSIVQALDVHKASSGYDPLSIVRQSIKQNHIHFDELQKPEVKADQDITEEKTKYEHELSNVFFSEKRQTVLLSATLTKAVETLAGLTMQDPVFIDCSEDRGTVIADSIIKPIKTEIKDEASSDVDDDDDLEIVPQESDETSDDEYENENESTKNTDHSENEEKSDESDIGDDGDDSDDSDDDVDDDDHGEQSDSNDSMNSEDDKAKVTIYKGLKMFSGIKPEKSEPNTNKEKKKKKSKNKTTCEKTENISKESDSDSDYDFFSAMKSANVDPSTKIITDSGNHSNPFQNAIKSAIAQDEMVIPSSVTQIYMVIPMKLRLVTLSALIVEKCVTPGHGKMLVFMGTQDMIDFHCELLSKVLTGKAPKKISISQKDKSNSKKILNQPEEKEENHQDDSEVEDSKNDDYEYNFEGVSLEAYEEKMRIEKAFVNVEFFQLHGSMDQKTRTEVFKTFRAANSGVLLCTDVAARGLDLPHVDCIVQYTGPISATDYVHRVGRTARAGNVGTAIMFLLPSEVLFVRQLEERRIRLHQEDMETTLNALNRKNDDTRRRHNAEQIAAAALQQTCEELVEADKELYLKACKAFMSWMRFYSTYPREARAAFDRKALHAGHAARALALRAAPKQVAKSVPKDAKERPNNRLTNQTPEERKERRLKEKKESIPAGFDSRATSHKSAKRDRQMMISEFDSGLEPVKKKKKNV